MKILNKKNLLHVVPLAFILAFLLWHMLVVMDYSDLQWWQYRASDFECGVLTSAIGLVNGGCPVTHTLYPAMTLFNIDALILKIIGLFDVNFRDILYIDGFENIKEVFFMLNQVVVMTRLSVLPSMFLFASCIYILFYLILRKKILAFFWTFFLITEPHVLYYNYVMRPETYSLSAFIIMLIIAIFYYNRANKVYTCRESIKYFMLIGFLIGCGLFSKIQIFPALMVYIGFMFYGLFMINGKKSSREFTVSTKDLNFGFLNVILNMMIFPWWTMTRPEHVTPELLSWWPWYDLYGPPPGKESFIALPIFFFLGVIALFLGLLAIRQNNKEEGVTKRVLPVFIFINMLVTGIIISVYCVGLGGFASFSSYLSNTHNMVYSTISNFYFAGQMDHKILNLDNFQRIYNQFIHVPFFVFSFLYVVIVGFLWSLIRFILKKTPSKEMYFFCLLMMGVGFGFDLLATLRAKTYMFNYGIYSVCFYVFGLVLLTAAEWRQVQKINSVKIRYGLMSVIIAILMIHNVQMVYGLSKKSVEYKVGNEYVGDYKRQFEHCIWQSEFFWDMVEAKLYEADAYQVFREAGTEMTWGQDHQTIVNHVKKHTTIHDVITPEDELGDIDELLIKYSENIAYKTYVYNFLLNVADQLFQLGHFDVAMEQYNKLIKSLPNVPLGYQQRARLFYQIGAFQESYKDLKKAQRFGASIDPAFEQRLEAALSQ